MKTTAENNLMICKFLGIRPEYELSDPLFNSTYSFHSSWNWLMSVVEKIKDLDVDTTDKEIVLRLTLSHGFDDVYSCVCKFIEWYNEQN
jgi:hypothetical protein